MKNIIILLAAFGVSCAGRGGTAEGGLVVIDISARYPVEEVVLQDIADVEYIPLAMSDEVLLSATDRLFHISDRFVMVQARGGIFVFDGGGRIVSHFNRTGRGPQEYASAWSVVFDEAAEEFFVVDGATAGRVQVYSLEGEYRRTLMLPGGMAPRIFDFDEATLLAYDESGLFDGGFSTSPYHLVSKADGAIVETLDISLPERYALSEVITERDAAGEVSGFRVWRLSHTNNRVGGGGGFTLADVSSDTVWRFAPGRALVPEFVRTPSVRASEPRKVWGIGLATDDFVLFEVLTLDFETAKRGEYPPVRRLMYDRATGGVTDVTFVDGDNRAAPWVWSDAARLPSGVVAQLLDPLTLREALGDGKLGGRLADLAARLDDGDNPVLVVATFK
ncbi:MAG: 6-bladed beta-propeller [Alistipes sp.]|jgi:hypothetical protein|nr:6-bladed beta-propeller [Alistipes sp.]